jgi:hypothetical protein
MERDAARRRSLAQICGAEKLARSNQVIGTTQMPTRATIDRIKALAADACCHPRIREAALNKLAELAPRTTPI